MFGLVVGVPDDNHDRVCMFVLVLADRVRVTIREGIGTQHVAEPLKNRLCHQMVQVVSKTLAAPLQSALRGSLYPLLLWLCCVCCVYGRVRMCVCMCVLCMYVCMCMCV